MYSDVKPKKPVESFSTSNTRVHCEGSSPALGHPRVYLQILPEVGFIACPYCSRQFVLKQGTRPAHGGH